MKPTTALLLALAIIIGHANAQPKKTTIVDTAAAFDQYVQKAMKEWKVPGLAIVVVKNNVTVFKKSYGVRELGTNNLVDNKTLFVCASTTKAMTATCLGILVDAGKLKWDDPVSKYLPNFQLYDPYVTKELRVRDLLLHNSGVGNTDFLWADNILSSDEILLRMRMVKPSYSFRSSFIYQNIFYLAAGKVVEAASGVPWSVFIKQHIFEPLGMNRTQALLKNVHDENQTKAHFKIDGKVTVIAHDTADATGPAGSVWSCIDDIGLWMKAMLDSSKYDGGRLVKPATWAEMLKPQTIVTDREFYPTQQLTRPNFKTYAMGWFQQDYKGRKLNFHTGSLSGAVAIHAQMPEEKTGVYIFANLDHAEIRHALMFKVFDLFALGGDRDWSADFLKLYSDMASNAEKQKAEAEKKRVLNTKPSLPLEAYCGRYEDALFGFAIVSLVNGQLNIVYNTKLSGVLTHWNYDTFSIQFDKKWYGKDLISFQLNTDGTVAGILSGGDLLPKVAN